MMSECVSGDQCANVLPMSRYSTVTKFCNSIYTFNVLPCTCIQKSMWYRICSFPKNSIILSPMVNGHFDRMLFFCMNFLFYLYIHSTTKFTYEIHLVECYICSEFCMCNLYEAYRSLHQTKTCIIFTFLP